MAQKIVFYVCDPAKNAGCSKRRQCMRARKTPEGCYTSDPKAAKKDANNQPIVAWVWEPMQ